ncbi:hypothetical protein D9611_003647 [Ephemerocybe angulata]|uniref:Uncharacterized protein n=1 Tax=Ephemerocybe angulata TaxID=980116 RepID=A0A8H5B5Q8_9AGAR|nr:hypothetical protein D9611_003647 [Tulosesus angulatus]
MLKRLANPGIARAGKRFLSSPPTQNPLQASYLRGGTSKGIYVHRSHLPSNQAEWSPILLGIMGSPDPTYGRQLNGMGGGVSSLSKVCVVGPASDKHRANGVDVHYEPSARRLLPGDSWVLPGGSWVLPGNCRVLLGLSWVILGGYTGKALGVIYCWVNAG